MWFLLTPSTVLDNHSRRNNFLMVFHHYLQPWKSPVCLVWAFLYESKFKLTMVGIT